MATINLWILSSVCFLVSSAEPLHKNGMNVCGRDFSYNSYYSVKSAYVSYDNYRGCCKKVFGWCTSRCTKYRTRISYYYKNLLRVKYSTSYFCCPGWARQGSECTRAICRPVCANGDCIAPNVCKCKPGFLGKTCDTEINECQAEPKPCEQVCQNLRGSYACSCRRGYRKIGTGPQDKRCENVNECKASSRLCKCAVSSPHCKATCVDTIGSYRCQCSAGFRLIANKVCTDVDECKAGRHNCQQLCVNDRGGFKCACRAGYWLRSDKRRCYDLNECRRANGGCEQLCTNLVGSYKCRCRNGFTLMYDKQRCRDVDECISKRPCDKYYGQCVNTYGSYRCRCDVGYELNRDGHTCRDLNECQRINKCQHKCHNTYGSYFCSCKIGFRLAYDKLKCVDIDECKEGLHDCNQVCKNNPGSFTCKCKQGYVLHTDAKSCKPIPCKTLYPPTQGNVKCNGKNVGDKCTFTCNSGYELIGSPVKTCMDNSRWSDEEAKCKPMACPRAHPPVNGALVLPCVEEYRSQCLVKCKRGYFLHGSPVIQCGLDQGNASWTQYNITCEALNLCAPNPCLNGGRCRFISRKKYECNCKGTGYSGENCQVGIITLPKFPQLVSGVTSDVLIMKAKPKNDITVTPQALSGGVVFTPSSISFTAPQLEARFTVRAVGQGLIRIKYVVSGTDKLEFSQPSDSFLYVVDVAASEKVGFVPETNFPTTQCHKLTVDRCANKDVIDLLSSCTWKTNGSLGYQSVRVKNTILPLSLAGVVFPPVGRGKWSYYAEGILTVAKETASMMKRGFRSCSQAGKCSEDKINEPEHKYILQSNLFLKSFLKTRNEKTPWWNVVKLIDRYGGFHINNIQSILMKGNRLKDLSVCKFPSSPTGIYSVNVNYAPLSIQLFSKRDTVTSAKATCLAVDLCGGMSFVSLPIGLTIDVSPSLQALGFTSLQLKLKGIGTSSNAMSGSIPSCQVERSIFNFKEKTTCIKSSLWAPIVAEYTLPNANLSLRGEVFVETSSVDKIVLTMFKSQVKSMYKGEMKATFHMTTAGKPFTIHIADTRDANAMVTYGEVSNKCDVCGKRGLQILTKSANVDFYPTSSVLSFHPTKNTDVQFNLLHNVEGGRVLKISDLVRLQLLLRVSTRSLPVSLQGLLLVLRIVGHKYAAEITSLNKLKAQLTTQLQSTQRLIIAPNPDIRNVYEALEELKTLIVATEDNLRLLSAQVMKYEVNAGLKSMYKARLKFLELSLKKIASTHVTPYQEKITEKYSGFSISYDGIVCFHALCLGKVKLSMLDLSGECNSCHFSNMPTSNVVILNGQFKEDRTFRGTIKVKKGAQLAGWVHKVKDEFQISFPADVMVFGKVHPVTVSANNERLSIQIKNAAVSKDLTSDIEIFALNSKRTRWYTMSFHVKGAAILTSPIVDMAQKYAKDYIKKAEVDTQNRLISVKKRVNATQSEYNKQRGILEEKKQVYDKKDKSYTAVKTQYLRSLAAYNRTLVQFRSYRVGAFFRNLEKRLNDTCPITSCKQICMSVPTCQVCQKPIFVDADTVKCDPIQKKVITTVEEPVSSICDMTKYNFVPIYTGTCKKSKKQALTGALVTAGTGTGALVGMAIGGPIGAAIGGVVGGLVGFVGSMFSSCDESYEVYKKVINYQIPCTRKVFNPKTKQWIEASCYTKVEVVLSGYDVPEECNCNNNTCTKVIDPICIVNNQECRRRREVMVRKSMESAGVYNDSYFKLNARDEELQEAFVKMKMAEQDKTEARRNWEMAVAIEKKFKLDAKLANQSLENSVNGLRLERCLMNLGKRIGSENIFTLQQVKFNSKILQPLDILLHVNLKSFDGGDLSGHFLYDFDDLELSVKQGAQKLVRNLYCKQHTRRRRSLTGDAPHTVSYDASHVSGFSFALISSEANITEANAACLVYSRVREFLSKSFTRLQELLQASKQRRERLQESIEALTTAHRDNEKAKRNPVLKAQLELLKNMEANADTMRKHEKDGVVYASWLKEMEIFSSANNFSSCMNFKDCLEQAILELGNLPSMHRIERSKYLAMLKSLEQDVGDILHLGKVVAVDKVTNVIEQLRELHSYALFCVKPPQVTLLEAGKIEKKSGSTVQLNCVATSKLKVRYQWLHNDSFLPGENSASLLIDVDKDAAGKYQCEAISKAGRSVSEEAFLIVGETPSFNTEPADFMYHFSMDKKIVPSFMCNVSAEPPASIEWYKEPFDSIGKPTLVGSSLPAVIFDSPVKSDAGLYYCEASNLLGKITSRKARFDVVASNFPNQALEMKFDVEAQANAVPDTSFYEKEVKKQADLKSSQSVNVSVQFTAGKKVNLGIKITDDIRAEVSSASRSRREVNNADSSDSEILRRVSSTRQSLAVSLQRVVTGLSRRTRRSLSSSLVENIENSLELSFDGDLCPDGYQLHTNGFTCIECSPGYFEHNRICKKCPIGTYQPLVGQTSCLECNETLVTANVASSSSLQCITPELGSIDVLFLLDSSRSVTRYHWYDVINFVVSFVTTYYKQENNMRVGVIVYSSRTVLEIPLRSYSINYLRRRLWRLTYHGSTTHTHDALRRARMEFQYKRKPNVPQLAIVVTDGKSSSSAGIPGNILTRKRAIELHKAGVHVFSIGVGNRVDPNELLSMATFPKRKNVLKLDDFYSLTLGTSRVAAGALRGVCSIPSTDIAVVVETSSRVGSDLMEKTVTYLTGLLNRLRSSDHRIALMTLDDDVRVLRSYSPLGSAAEIANLLTKLKVSSKNAAIVSGLTKIYNVYMTEAHKAFSQRKILLLITVDDLEDAVMQRIHRHYPDEDVTTFNILMSLQNVEEDIENFGVGTLRTIFSLSQLNQLMQVLHEYRGLGC